MAKRKGHILLSTLRVYVVGGLPMFASTVIFIPTKENGKILL